MTVRARHGAARGRFLDPEVLARIDDLELVARTVVDGFVAGLHESPYLGFSLDFAEHRAYMPGDDIRRIDWRLFARTDRHYVKQFEAETNANVVVALDVSGSMGYGSGPATKLDYARWLAAALAFLSGRQRDRIGLVTFDDGPVETVPAAVRHLRRVLHTLNRAEAGGEGSVTAALDRLGDGLARRGILIVVSDLYEDPDELVRAVRALQYRGQDVVVFQVLDPAELDLPEGDGVLFRDLETGETTSVVADDVRDEYGERIRAHLEALEDGFTASRTEYALLNTSRPLDEALYRYLTLRRKRARVR